MTKIYLIRHAEAEGNLYRLIQGHTNSALTADGLRQLDCLAARFQGIHLDAVYSSDLRRAADTARCLLRERDLELVTLPALREMYMGINEGKSFGDMTHDDPQMMYYFNNDPDKWHTEGAESYADVANRVLPALKKIAAAHEGGTVAVVSHGVAIRATLARIMNVPSAEISKTLMHGENTCVSLLAVDGDDVKVEYFNDGSHLPEELSTYGKQSWWKNGGAKLDNDNLRYIPLDPNKDGELYLECYADSWKTVHGDLNGFYSSLYLNDAKKLYALDPGSILAVYSGEDFAGLIELDSARGKKDGFGWLSLIYLKPEFRGRGLGVQPLGMALTVFRRKGFRSVRLHVSSLNTTAIALYEKYGFVRIGTDKGCGAPLYLMEKVLE